MHELSLPGSPRDERLGELRLADVWCVATQNYRFVLTASVLGILLGLAAALRSPKLYTATATVELNKDASSGLNLQDLSGSASQVGSGPDFMLDMLTQQAVLQSDNTALSVMQRVDIMKDAPYSTLRNTKVGRQSIDTYGPDLDHNPVLRDQALAIFKNGLQVNPVKNTRLITVAFTDTYPARAALIANTVVDAYLDNHTQARYSATAKASRWLTDQLTDLKKRAEQTHQQVSDYEKQNGISGLPLPSATSKGDAGAASNSGMIAYQQLSALNAELTRAEIERISKEAVYRLTSTGDPNVIMGVANTSLAGSGTSANALSVSSSDMQLIQSLRAQESSLKVRLAAAKVPYGANNPAVVELEKQIGAIEQQLGDEVRVVNERARVDFRLATAQETAMKGTVQQQQREFATVGNKLGELGFLQQEENSTRVLYQDLYNRLEEANIAAGVKSSGVSIVDPARRPSQISSPSIAKDLAFGLCGGALLGLLIAGVREAVDRSLHTPASVSALSPYPLLGIIPHVPRARFAFAASERANLSVSGAWVASHPKSEMAEAYRQVSTSILLSRPGTQPRVLLFTSAVAGEGKSLTVLNVAAALARQSSSVVLVEADMRRPSLAKAAGLDSSSGLSTLLSSDVPLESVLRAYPGVENLSVIPSGPIPSSPAELLGSARFADVIKTLRGRFAYVLIDSPPALPVSDALLIARYVDASLGVVRSGAINSTMLQSLWQALAKPPAPVLGYVLNDFDPHKDQSGSYRYASYFDGSKELS